MHNILLATQGINTFFSCWITMHKRPSQATHLRFVLIFADIQLAKASHIHDYTQHQWFGELILIRLSRGRGRRWRIQNNYLVCYKEQHVNRLIQTLQKRNLLTSRINSIICMCEKYSTFLIRLMKTIVTYHISFKEHTISLMIVPDYEYVGCLAK